MLDDPRQQTILTLGLNPRLAHQALFGHRHPQVTPDFHYEIIDLWHSANPRVLIKAFRGAAKSTIAEEAITVQACLRKFKNGIILGETYERAVERLRAIKHELETNQLIEELFGNLVGGTWSEGKIILSNGVIIQAFGRGQSLRGSKHLDWRPDRAFGDDIENEESVATPEAIAKCMAWVMSVVIPALDPSALVRINGTPLNPKSVLEQLSRDQDWITRTYPIESVSPDTGQPVPTWPDRFDLPWIEAKRASYARLGLYDNFMQEFMCKAEDQAQKPFTSDLLRVEPTVRTWQAVYAMYDPARTVKTTSASTGVAVWSWVNNRLIVWDAYARLWKPDEIIHDMFALDEIYKPVVIGVETDGLEEFISQPLRQEQLRRSYAIPIRPLKAPKGKLDFIKSLQPFFKAREVIFAKDLPDAREQLLGFPSGRIDVPNALAYALRLRPGQPVFDDFSAASHVFETLPLVPSQPVFVVANTDGACTTAALVQIIDGRIHVLADWVREGDAGTNLGVICQEAGVFAQQKVRLFAGGDHFSAHDRLGLRAAARSVPIDVGRGGPELRGREAIRDLLRRQVRGYSAFRVSSTARWTLNALAGGYAREIDKRGMLSDLPVPGPYGTLMAGLESFVALMGSASLREEEPVRYTRAPDGRRYISSMGATHGR